jgi:hypothetical protein
MLQSHRCTGSSVTVCGEGPRCHIHVPGFISQNDSLERIMYLVRDIMYCKPGKVRPMVEKFTAMSKLSERMGMPKMRIMTDMVAERYWTVVSEMEVPNLKAFEDMMANPQGSAEDMKEFENIMKGYHDLVDHGKREIYKVEV